MPELIVVPYWEQDFENAKSRTIAHSTYYLCPNHFDGKKIRRLQGLKNCVELYGAFHAIRAVASRCWYRGVLLDKDGPIDALNLSAKTGFPPKPLQKAIDELCKPGVALLEKHAIEQIDGKWELPEPVRNWAVSQDRRRTLADPRSPASPRENPRDGSKKAELVPRNGSSPDLTVPRESTQSPTGPQESAHSPTGSKNRTEQKGTEDPPTVPQGDREESAAGDLGFTDSKTFLNEIFGRKRAWSYEEDQLLSALVPIHAADVPMIRAWFKLPHDHPLFASKQTKPKQELTTFLRDFNGELDKMRRFRAAFMPRTESRKKEKEPAHWREYFRWSYDEDCVLPESYHDLDETLRREWEKHGADFVENTLPKLAIVNHAAAQQAEDESAEGSAAA